MLPALAYYAPQRTTSEIVMYLAPSQPTPSSVPFELQNYVATDIWISRISTITRTTASYSKPLFERIWAVIGVLVTMIIPLVLHQVVFRSINIPRTHAAVQQDVQARAIGLGVFVGLALLFFIPIALWKYLGRRQVDRMLQEWAKSDRITSGNSSFIPIWKVKTPGIFRTQIILTVSLPPNSSPSSFHPNAYLPSYLNGPVDADANYYYPYKAEPGLPRMSVVGNVPLYLDEKRAYDKV